MVSEWRDLAKIACRAAQLGATILKEWFGKVNPASIEQKRVNDWVSSADRSSEEAIINFLSRQTPEMSIYTEEKGFIGSKQESKGCWLIDPLDGTTNFIRGFPVWAVSVGLEWERPTGAKWGEIVAGAIAIPSFREVFYAVKEGGAYRNEERLPILTHSRNYSSALLCTGFPFRSPDYRESYLGMFGEVMKVCANIRRPGAVAIDLCYTALGAFDGFWELDLSPWDLAAGILIIRETGGNVFNFQGGEDVLTTGDIIAGRPPVLNLLQELVSKYFPSPRVVDKTPARN